MSSAYGGSGTQDGAYDGSSWLSGGREPGTRRRKLAGYLKAANELRQTYQQNYVQSRNGTAQDGMPGAFPDADSVSGAGVDEMLIFPSYARRHIKSKPTAVPGTIQETAGYGRDIRDTAGSGDAEYWKQQWEQYEDDNAVVDVDVRGWLSAPQKGALTRRQRLFISLARQMVGISAPTGKSPTASPSGSRASSPHGVRERLETHADKKDNEIVNKEAENLVRRGEAEAQIAGKGGYSERFAGLSSTSSLSVHEARSREGSPVPGTSTPNSRTGSDSDDTSSVQRQSTWNSTAQMTPAELATANSRLMERLQPFLATPGMNIPISAFFYNDDVSRQKTIETNSSGHFAIRASLDFVPTHVRILASDSLSLTEEVHITEAKGVSVISDVDDTIKHSAITSGAREIFRNVFIRDLGDLSIDGVKDWYGRLSEMGVAFHYVSNSPWQLFSLLTNYFTLAGLPTGSFHLKQYNGMLQGIFEPVAERKRGSLDRILQDFPERKFILIGDSGEADLELYTDIVMEYPGRILGVFIRDITTSAKKEFFDSAMAAPSHLRRAATTGDSGFRRGRSREDDDMDAAIAASLKDHDSKRNGSNPELEFRPKLPPRRPTEPITSHDNPDEEDLIDLNSEDEAPPLQKAKTAAAKVPPIPRKPVGLSGGQTKPSSLRNETLPNDSIQRATQGENTNGRPALPRKPSSSVDPVSRSPQPQEASSKPPRPEPPPARLSNRVKTSASNNSTESNGSRAKTSKDNDEIPPPIPPRKPNISLSATAASYASSLYNTAATASPAISSYLSSYKTGGGSQGDASNGRTGTANSANPTASYSPSYDPNSQLSKKEELWRRRWARSKQILESKGVVLRSWRVGTDVMRESVRLVEGAMQETQGPSPKKRS